MPSYAFRAVEVSLSSPMSTDGGDLVVGYFIHFQVDAPDRAAAEQLIRDQVTDGVVVDWGSVQTQAHPPPSPVLWASGRVYFPADDPEL